jgi:hypothetical protein
MFGSYAVAADTDRPEAAAQASALTPEVRRCMEEFLVEKLDEHDISHDLLRIIMRRVDAYAWDLRVPQEEQDSPLTTSYPSVALQISWQGALEEIADDFRAAFPVRPRPGPARDLVFMDEPPALPSLESIFSRTPELIEEAQGKFSEVIRRDALPEDFHLASRPSAPVAHIGNFTVPVRINSTGITLIDEAIAEFLARSLRPSVPLLPVDHSSFPSNEDASNIIIPRSHLQVSGVNHVLRCARSRDCWSLKDLYGNSDAERATQTDEELFTFLDTVYLTNPYGHRTTAVVQQNSSGEIISSFCSLPDIGYSPSSIDRAPLDTGILRACLEAAMGN